MEHVEDLSPARNAAELEVQLQHLREHYFHNHKGISEKHHISDKKDFQ